ncbi:GyrI-like domain-containing protein [Salegentibacter sp. JZCK2]|uniref:GyrI-like domain-containing protein n=1 Tax=Salegentibacter tibetensis TaxID=2873600 RepID=UPI001CCE53E5|nr:GyrI-like domain-containing protein [Salegentibacter tibetensis]MBZ9729341.1 GyrI-like domain-containing protein [Salegentibacter tibetensis]
MKKIFLLFLTLVLLGLIWFLFIKKYDYQFRMEAKYGPGTVYHEISEWKRLNSGISEDNIVVTQSEPFKNLTQKVYSYSDSPIEFYWEFEKRNDSITEVILNLRSEENSLANRLDIINPFVKSIYLDSLKQHLLAFRHKLKSEQKAYRIQIPDSIVISPAMDCICHTSENIPVKGKAIEMVQTIDILEDYILSRDLKLTGNPFVKIIKWNREENMIDFEFCFPVNLAQDIRPYGKVEFRQVRSSTSLKAVFNGNYRLSHKAWYDLLYEAEEKGLKTNQLPLEIFFNNPNIESNPSPTWKAEIYMPVVE